MRRLFVIAIAVTIGLPMVAALLLFAAAGSQAQCGGGGPAGPGSAPGIPASLLGIYDQAAGAYQLGPQGWAYLAAINYVETRFGQDLSPSSQGAIGWMQFEPGTWAQYAVSADPTKPGAPPDPYDPWDAIFAAANDLHANGAPGDWPRRSTPTTTPAGTSQRSSSSPSTTPKRRAARSAIDASQPPRRRVALRPVRPRPGRRRGSSPTGSPRHRQDAPAPVQAAIAAGNQIIDTSYSTEREPNMLTTVMSSYDCSGSTDFVLYNAGLNAAQVDVGNGIAGDSGMLESYGDPGPGRWITVFASGGHAFIEIAGILLDTSRFGAPTMPTGSGPRWQPTSILTAQLNDETAGPNDIPGPLRRGSIPRRSLLAGLCLLVFGIAALQPATRSSTRTTRAAAARIPSPTAAGPTTARRSGGAWMRGRPP